MKGFLRRIFGGTAGAAADSTPAEATEYKGFRIRPAPFAAEGQWQTAGVIEKDFADGRKEHRFIRAERHASRDDAADLALSKGRQIIDEQGDGVFRPR